MPELPDVETFRSYLDATALHQQLAEIRVRQKRILDGLSAGRLERALKGISFEATDRHGKYLFIHTNEVPILVLHFGMTGYLEYEKGRESDEHDCILFEFENGYSLAYVCRRLFGKVTLTDSAARFVEEHELGPDAMRVGREDFLAVLHGSRATVKSYLMNQSLIAGVGNIYSDEILFQSHISPERKGNTLGGAKGKQLHRQMRRVLALAIQRKADPAKMPSSWLLPHRDKGVPCPRCRGKIAKVKVAGRSAYWCPHCQSD